MEKFLEKLEANKTSVTKEIAARLMRIIENGFIKDLRRIDLTLIIPQMRMGKYGEILAILRRGHSAILKYFSFCGMNVGRWIK